MIKYDFVNFTPEKCKRLMLEYQETRDYEIFHALLAKFDRFLLFVIYKFQRKCYSLHQESLQSLYHSGILGFVKAILAAKETWDAEYLCNKIKSYVVSELKQVYMPTNHSDKITEMILVTPQDTTEDFTNAVSVKLLMESDIITDKERQLLKMHYFEGLTTRMIGKKIGVSHSTVVVRLKKVRQKFRNNYNQRADI